MYHNSLKEYKSHMRTKQMQHDSTAPEVYMHIGPPGTGKTRRQWMDDTFSLDRWTYAPDNTGKWFDYRDNNVILFYEVELGQVTPLSVFKRLTDSYPLKAPVKGSWVITLS